MKDLSKDFPTNVLKLARAIKPYDSKNVPQQVFYDWGIGSYYDRVVGGVTGRGLHKNIMRRTQIISAMRRRMTEAGFNEFSTPILLTIGEKDFRVPINQTISAWSYVQRKQVPGRLLVFHDANHWIMKGEEARYFWDEVFAWLDQYLGEGE